MNKKIGLDINPNYEMNHNDFVLKSKRAKFIMIAHQRRKQAVALDFNLRQILRRQHQEQLNSVKPRKIKFESLLKNNQFKKITSLPDGIFIKFNPEKRVNTSVTLSKIPCRNKLQTEPCSRILSQIRHNRKKESNFISNKQKFLGKKVILCPKINFKKITPQKDPVRQYAQSKNKRQKVSKSELKQSQFSGWGKQTQYNETLPFDKNI